MLNRVFTYISGIRIYTNIVSQRSDNRFYRYTISALANFLSLRSDWLGDKLSLADYCRLAQSSTKFGLAETSSAELISVLEVA